VTDEPKSDLPAGRFSTWVRELERGQHDETGAQVPCGECTGCCTSSQFIHIAPDEVETISHIPRALLFPSPGLPKGHVLLGYDHHGHCPMFRDQRCSIYEHRPRTCRSYDCRVFPAAGVELCDDDQSEIVERTRRWTFDFPTSSDRIMQAAIQAAATFLREHTRELPEGLVPRNRTQLAFLAVKIHDVFLEPGDGAQDARLTTPPLDVVQVAVQRTRRPAGKVR